MNDSCGWGTPGWHLLIWLDSAASGFLHGPVDRWPSLYEALRLAGCQPYGGTPVSELVELCRDVGEKVRANSIRLEYYPQVKSEVAGCA